MSDAAGPRILDASGQPMTPARPRSGALAGSVAGARTPFDAAGFGGEHMAAWRPYLTSVDNERNPYRDVMVARSRDQVRNDGWASGAVTRIADNAVGATFRPIAKPDHRALAAQSGAAFDAMWADEFGRALNAKWRDWADDPACYCDAQRSLTLPMIFAVAFRHLLIDGDTCASLPWLPERVRPGAARYATAVQLIDPDRLGNPQMLFDTASLRGGVEVDSYGAAVAYHFRRAHVGDWWAAADSLTWDRLPRETDFGRPLVVHYFEAERAGQHRGGAGIFTPVLERLRMLFRYDVAELDGAIINAVFAAIAESPFDQQMLAEAMGEGDMSNIVGYQDLRAGYHDTRRLEIGGAKVVPVFPGEKLTMVRSERPNANFAGFEKAVLRNVAAAAGTSSQQISNDWSDTNYSSARAALLEAWKTISRRRTNFASGFAMPIRMAWLEEAMDIDDLPLPAGAPPFEAMRAAYSRARWMGPGRGWIDPVAEKQGAVLGMDAGLSTLEYEAAENAGEDYEDILDQRQAEIEGFKRRGLDPPSWAQMNVSAAESSKPPQKPDSV